ncbi:MAG: LemA family protein [Acidobacteriota bacterium]|nr:LemA family protein [Acidobacteriota bacterium]
MMCKQRILSILVLIFAVAAASQMALAQAQTGGAPPAKPPQAPQAGAPPINAKPIKRDEVYFSIARLINSLNESQVSAVVAELDGVFEVTNITVRTDGKSEVTVKERAPSNASSTQKSIRLLFTPPATGEKYTWTQFEDSRTFYAVDRIFAYAKDTLGKRKQNTMTTWGAFIAAVVRQGEAANKVLDTAKAIIKAEPPPTAAVTAARNALTEALKENKYEETVTAYNDLAAQNDPVLKLGDTYSDLKANDAYVRLLEEFKNAINVTNAMRKNYVQSVESYNESLVRLPLALVAYGLQFTKIESKITAD